MIEWSTDPTGKWTDMQIELKTGSNLAMVPLQGTRTFVRSPRDCRAGKLIPTFIVITKIDATKETRFVYPCPKVRPFLASHITFRVRD